MFATPPVPCAAVFDANWITRVGGSLSVSNFPAMTVTGVVRSANYHSCASELLHVIIGPVSALMIKVFPLGPTGTQNCSAELVTDQEYNPSFLELTQLA